MVSIQRVKSEFQRIKGMGYVLSDKPYTEKNDGALGNTFESLLGVRENNLTGADFEGWECKSQRLHSKSAASLFTLKPDFPQGGDEHMRENWGVPDKDYPHIKTFRTSIYAHKWGIVYEQYKMKLEVDDENEKLKIILCDMDETVKDDSVYFSFESLKRASSKLKNTFAIAAEEKVIDGKIHFKFLTGTAYMGFSFTKLIQLIKQGKARYDNRLGVYKSGEYIGRKHNHGGGIRLVKASYYKELFDHAIEL